MADLRAFTRELMADAERDLGTKLDWVAVDHWNTDNPHIHVLVRGRADDGEDLVISRDYIKQGFRDRAAERVTLELGPRSEQEIRTALEKEVEAERWTSLDRSLRDISDEGGGVADLRPGGGDEDPELRRLMLGRAAKLERLGLAEQVGWARWTLKPGIEQTLRELGIRGDIIKTMHRAMTGAGREPDVTGFALHGDDPVDPVLGRLVERGLHDELRGRPMQSSRGSTDGPIISPSPDGPHAPWDLDRPAGNAISAPGHHPSSAGASPCIRTYAATRSIRCLTRRIAATARSLRRPSAGGASVRSASPSCARVGRQ